MGYAQGRSSGHRAATAIGVALLQGVAIYAVVTGPAVHFIPRDQAPRTAGYQIPVAPPPTTEPSDRPQADQPLARPLPDPFVPKPVDPPPVPQILTGASDSATGIALDDGDGDGDGDGAIAPAPSATPSFAPRQARPANDPARGATPNDYPAADLRRETQGVARFALAVGADGRVQSCRIVATSGSPSLDAATCRLVSQRARFRPATEVSGAQTAGSYSSAIIWQIPKD